MTASLNLSFFCFWFLFHVVTPRSPPLHHERLRQGRQSVCLVSRSFTGRGDGEVGVNGREQASCRRSTSPVTQRRGTESPSQDRTTAREEGETIAGLAFFSLSIVLQALPQVSPNRWVSQEAIFSSPLGHLHFRFIMDLHAHGLDDSVIHVQSPVIRIVCMPCIPNGNSPRLSLCHFVASDEESG